MTQHPLTVWRQQNSLSQDSAASLLGLSRWTINQIEVGKYIPSGKLARRISNSTGVPTYVLNPDIFPKPSLPSKQAPTVSEDIPPSQVPHG